jgi:hypothetical protein
MEPPFLTLCIVHMKDMRTVNNASSFISQYMYTWKINSYTVRNLLIDISWLDWAYKSPVTSCIDDSAAIYIMVVKFRNTIWPPPPQLSFHRRAALSSNSNGTWSVYSRENPKRSLYCEMSVNLLHCLERQLHNNSNVLKHSLCNFRQVRSQFTDLNIDLFLWISGLRERILLRES